MLSGLFYIYAGLFFMLAGFIHISGPFYMLTGPFCLAGLFMLADHILLVSLSNVNGSFLKFASINLC